MADIGIDYGMGQTNIDKETGIRFGVIPMNDLAHWAWESFEDDYGDPTCPKCGNEAMEYDEECHCGFDGEGSDYACEDCCYSFMSDEAFGDEVISSHLDDGEYVAQRDSDGDIFITKSPYYTHAQFCSPCAPGAGHLSHPVDGGAKTYCFGHDWFEDGVAPYPVYEVATGKLVEPKCLNCGGSGCPLCNSDILGGDGQD